MVSGISKATLRKHFEDLSNKTDYSGFAVARIDVYDGICRTDSDIVRFIDIPKDTPDVIAFVRQAQNRLADQFDESAIYVHEYFELGKSFAAQLDHPKTLPLAPVLAL
jgi:hypothetical protein